MDQTAVLHVGYAKAGSSSIQETLFKSSEILLGHGIYVPTKNGKPANHRMISDLVAREGDETANVRLLETIDQDVARHNPHLIILSSEHLARNRDGVAYARELTSRWTEDLRVIIYLREPVRSYVSFQQQRVRAHYNVMDIRDWSLQYRLAIDLWRSVVGENLVIVPFQSPVTGPDFVKDFVGRFTDISKLPEDTLNIPRGNPSEAAEISCIIQKYFRTNYFGEKRKFRDPASMLRKILIAVSKEHNLGTKAVLRPELKDILLANSCDDLLWLRETENIVFDGIDYDALPKLAPARDFEKIENLSDLLITDPAVQAELEHRAMHVLTTQLLDAQKQNTKLRKDLSSRMNAEKGRRRPIRSILRRLYNFIKRQI